MGRLIAGARQSRPVNGARSPSRAVTQGFVWRACSAPHETLGYIKPPASAGSDPRRSLHCGYIETPASAGFHLPI